MHDAENQDRLGTELWDEFEVELSDLPPSARSHHLLLRLAALKSSLREARQAFFAPDRQTGQQISQAGSREDEDALEISDLPPSTRIHYWLIRLVALKKRLLPSIRASAGSINNKRAERNVSHSSGEPLRRPTRARVGRVLTALGLCVALLVLLLGSFPDLLDRLTALVLPPVTAVSPTATSSFTYASIQIVTSSAATMTIEGPQANDSQVNKDFGSLPLACPHVSQLQHFQEPLDTTGIRTGPIWITGFTGPIAVVSHIQSVLPTNPASIGSAQWYTTLGLLIPKGYQGTIHLLGGDQISGRLFEISDISQQYKTLTFSANLQDPATQRFLFDEDLWEILPVNVYLPTASCYYLQTSWDNNPGSWTAYFAAGA